MAESRRRCRQPASHRDCEIAPRRPRPEQFGQLAAKRHRALICDQRHRPANPGDGRDRRPTALDPRIGTRELLSRWQHRRRRPFPLIEVVRQCSDVDLLCDFDRVIDFDAKISNGAFDLRVSQRLGFTLGQDERIVAWSDLDLRSRSQQRGTDQPSDLSASGTRRFPAALDPSARTERACQSSSA